MSRRSLKVPRGMRPSLTELGVTPEAGILSRGVFAALLSACREACECRTCIILREVADRMAAEFTLAKRGE